MQKKSIFKYLTYSLLAILLSLLLIPSVFNNLKFGLDLQGGFEVLYQVSGINGEEVTDDMLTNTYKTISKRIDSLGISEPVITVEGNDKIRVQLAGVTDSEEARNTLGQVATLTFRDSSDNLLMTSDVLVSGGSSVGQSSNGLPAVSLKVSKKDEFYRVTSKISKTTDKLIVIWLDFEEGTNSYEKEKALCGTDSSNCLSAATVSEGFSSDVVIQGNFTTDEVKNLVTLINSGSLPTKLDEISSKTVDASFGVNSLNKTFLSGVVGFVLVSLLMICLYRFSGFISVIGLLVYIVATLGTFWLVGGVLTLPGIAAIIIGIGMAVDSNVINFSRIKDELNDGSNFSQAVKKGNTNSLKTIIDANITTFLVALILFIFGETSVKGFALMLMISIVVTMLVMVGLTRIIMKKFVETGYFDNKAKLFIGKIKTKKRSFDYVKSGKMLFIFTLIIIVISVISFFINGLNLGIDFKGGTLISIGKEIDKNQITSELKDYTIDSIEVNETTVVRVKENLSNDEIKDLGTKFTEEYETSTDIGVVSNLVKRELVKNAIYSVLFSLIGIAIYISFRFKFSFGVGAIASLAHDVFMMIAVFSLLKIEVSSIFIAALLSIIGYSINDTIVIFDRIIENKNSKKINNYNDLKAVVNKSLDETVVRSLITSLTTIITVICLIVLGSKEIINFNIALLIGLIAGAYSSIFIAAQLWLLLEKKNINKPLKKKWYE